MPDKAKPGKKFTGELRDYKSKYLRCRGRRNHPWKIKTDFDITTKTYRGETRVTEFRQILHCAICTTQRIDRYRVTDSGRFERIGHPQYDYAPGYELHRGSKFATDEARDELLLRELGGSINTELMNRLLSMRPDVQREIPRLRVVGGESA